jgi:hypothetical protein
MRTRRNGFLERGIELVGRHRYPSAIPLEYIGPRSTAVLSILKLDQVLMWVVLKVVYDNLNGRDIIFSSFHPDICMMLALKQVPPLPLLEGLFDISDMF